MSIKDHLDDYYLLKISLNELCKRAGVGQTTIYKYLNDNNLLAPRRHYGRIDMGDEQLNQMLKGKYASIVSRCNDNPSTEYQRSYKDKEYMPIHRWADFCIANKEKIIDLWNFYVSNEKEVKFAVSIDRLDNDKGYTEDNLHFVTHGFNSWKRNVNPIQVLYKGKLDYFMSCQEASHFYGARSQDINECLRRAPKHKKQYVVNHSTVDVVLNENGVKTIEEYYKRFNERFNKRRNVK